MSEQGERVRLGQERELQIRVGMKSCQFFTAEDAMAWAITAYRRAVAELRPPKGESWCEQGCEWSGPIEFGGSFLHHFERRFWDACERSQLYRDDRQKRRSIQEAAPSFFAPQEPVLPLSGSVAVDAVTMGPANDG